MACARACGGLCPAGRIGRFRMQGCHWLTATALRHYIACHSLATAALGGYAQLKLDVVKTHARVGMAGNFTVRDAMADTDNHGA
jgi:hypothetical protein